MENDQTHYHLHYRKFTRSDGKSAVESAAYRVSARLHDERTGLTHDYTAKRGVTETISLGPTGQTVPAWAHDPNQLWNQVEAAEKNNPRSLVMHELEIALPASLTKDQRRGAALEMAQFVADRYGAMTQMAFHNPNREGDERNYHIHLMFTPRAITEDGFTKKKFRNFSRREAEAQRDGELSGAEEILLIRKTWANIGNKHLVMAGHAPNLDHRSYEDQGLDLEPQKHLGPEATAKERRGEATAKGDFNRVATDRNQRRQAWANAWEQAKTDITGEPLPEPPPRPKKPFADTPDAKKHEEPPAPFSKAFQTLMENQKTERTSMVQLHITEKKNLWHDQQEFRQSQKKRWSQLYRQQKQERESLHAKFGKWSSRLLRKLDFTGKLKKGHQDAIEGLERRQKIERAQAGRLNRQALKSQSDRLQDKQLNDLRRIDKTHLEQRQEFLAREARNRAIADRFKAKSKSRDQDRGRGRER